MVKDEIKKIEKKLKKVEEKLSKAPSLPEELDETLQKGTKKIIDLLDLTIRESVPCAKKKPKSTLKLRKGMKIKLFGKKKK